MSTIGDKIALLRKERKWLQADLAERSGLKIPTISRIETGLRSASLDEKVAIARAFGVAVSDIDPDVSSLDYGAKVIEILTRKPPRTETASSRPGYIPLFVQNTSAALGEFALGEAMQTDVEALPHLVNVPGAFAIQIPDMGMAPRFKAGETIFIHPKAPIRPNDDVVILWDQDGKDSPIVYAGQYLGVIQPEAEDGQKEQTESCFNIFQVGRSEEIEVPVQGSKIMKIVGVLFP